MMNGMTRRSFIGALGASAASLPMAGIALADAPALTESESGTKTVEGGEVDHKELYGSQGREGMWLDATQAELDALLLDEPEVTEDLVLPDGTVVDKRYVALRNRLNRMSEGLANDPLENSYEIIMRLWTPEEAQQFVDCPNQVWFTAFDYVKKQREKVEDISFVTGGISGSDYGTGSKYPILHVCPVSADVVEGGVISPYRDWRLIIENNTSFGIGECICRKAALTRGDAEMDGFKRDHVWKEGADGEGFIDTCMVFGQYADCFIEQGLAERVTKEQMIANIECAIEDGFVPDMYWAQHPEIMCLCRSDMCDVLTSYRRVHGMTDNRDRVTAYDLKYDKDACIKCGVCIDRCPMKAVGFGDDGYCVMDTACVACGQCALKCPAGARILTPKDDFVKRMPQEKVDDFRDRARYRMQRGFIRDFVGESLDNNVADNDFAAQLEALRAGK